MTVNTLSSGKAVGVLADEFASVLGEMDYVFPAVNLALRLGYVFHDTYDTQTLSRVMQELSRRGLVRYSRSYRQWKKV
jgi:hypothetical protein